VEQWSPCLRLVITRRYNKRIPTLIIKSERGRIQIFRRLLFYKRPLLFYKSTLTQSHSHKPRGGLGRLIQVCRLKMLRHLHPVFLAVQLSRNTASDKYEQGSSQAKMISAPRPAAAPCWVLSQSHSYTVRLAGTVSIATQKKSHWTASLLRLDRKLNVGVREGQLKRYFSSSDAE
jgi:hypothetical protein